MSYSRSGVPFGLPVENKNYWGAPVESGVLVLDQDINLMQRIQDEKLKTFLDSSFKDGWHYFDGFHSFGTNTFKINPGAFTLAGKISQWIGAFTSDNQITLPAAGGSPRTDLVWIEQWIEEVDSADVIYPYGNVDYYAGGVANDIVDPAVGSACTNRVQVRYRTRITPNASSLSDVVCTAQGAQGTPGVTPFSFDAVHNNWLAGTGDTSYSLLDGKVYALPICTILRPAGDNTVYEANVSSIRLHNSLSTATTKFISSNVLLGEAAGLALGSAVGCTFMGHEAGRTCTSNYNTFIGYHAGQDAISGISNIFIGYNAGKEVTGDQNISIGYEAGKHSTGSHNIFIGDHAGDDSILSSNGVYMGCSSGLHVDGADNVGVGHLSLRGDVGGSTAYENTCVGSNTGIALTTGYRNVFIGYRAGERNTSGHRNVFIGYLPGANETGDGNIYIGHTHGAFLATDDLFIVDNQGGSPLFYGNLSTHHLGIGCMYSTYFGLNINGHCGPNIDNAYDLGRSTYRWDDVWATNGTIQTCDVTQKIVHTDKADLGLDFINRLKPIAFTWKDRDIAEETEHIKYEQQKINRVLETAIAATTELRDGKYVKVMQSSEVEKEVPEVELVNLYDEQNNIIGTHEKPVMETIEYDKVITPAKFFKYTRTHYGLSAQDVKQTLDDLGIDTQDFAGYIHDPASGIEALRIAEFVPPMMRAIQELSAKVKVLEGT